MNEEEPQSRQTRSFGNTKTPELSESLRNGKWIFTSAENSLWLPDWQNVHGIAYSPRMYNLPL